MLCCVVLADRGVHAPPEAAVARGDGVCGGASDNLGQTAAGGQTTCF